MAANPEVGLADQWLQEPRKPHQQTDDDNAEKGRMGIDEGNAAKHQSEFGMVGRSARPCPALRG